MATIIHNAIVITPTAGQVRVLRGHSLVFDRGRVIELGPAAGFAERVARGEFETVIAGQRYIVIPGLVNAHHHLYQSLTRCLPAVQDRRLFGWLLGLYEHWQHLDYEAVKLATKVSLAELLLHGCTTTNDHFYMLPPGSDVRMEAALEAAEELGVRIHLCRGSMTLGQSAGGLPPDNCVERDADVLADCERVLDAYHDPEPYALYRIDLAPCSPFNVTRELLRDTRIMARQRGVLLHTHLAETLDEQRYCLERFGCRPTQYLADLDWLGADVYLAHCVWLNDEEIGLLGRTRTGVVHCPTSNLRLGSGIAPMERLLAAGARVGLGVDGSSSQDGGNLLAEIKQALLVARVLPALATGSVSVPLTERADQSRDREGAVQAERPFDAAQGKLRDTATNGQGGLFSVAEAFKLATVGSAACLNRGELGHLNPGAAADFAMFRADDIALAGAVGHDPLAALVLCAPPRAERVFVAGREVVRDGHVVGCDERGLAERMNTVVAARLGG